MTNNLNKENITSRKNESKSSEIIMNKDNIFLNFLEHNFRKKSFNFFLTILFINFISLLMKFSIGLYGYSGKNILNFIPNFT